ncbi:hypothetical protein VXN68_07065 [Acinetobacter schindleri]|uniref:hypothetical protein n=1 Tax=Acinetobacter schindleri TaxID=108981 RepID=UPI000EC3909A|nr:hypothetical protein FSC12_12120 [Acinetobacter schindleri]HAA06741.1 hypothetical protein [Acinetobacter schindleri]
MDKKTLENLAEFICGTNEEIYPVYRKGSDLTSFFHSVGISVYHDGSTRAKWVFEQLVSCSKSQLADVLKRLASPKEYSGNHSKVISALRLLNKILYIEGFEIYLEGIEPKFKKIQINFSEKIEPEFKPIPRPNFLVLGLEPGVGEILDYRWDEIQRCIEADADLSAVILMGSLLEGLLLGVIHKNIKLANQAYSAPKTREGKVKPFSEWKLSEMIDVAHSLGWIEIDVKRFSHSLREFRNLIHPYEHMISNFNPNKDTTSISWLVVQAAINDLTKTLS